MTSTHITDNDLWTSDLKAARKLLLSPKPARGSDAEWLNEVIESATYEEIRFLRAGLSNGPQGLWYDYQNQCWID